MVSYSELIQIGILIIALMALVYEIYQDTKK
jgi:hypothetical protein